MCWSKFMRPVLSFDSLSSMSRVQSKKGKNESKLLLSSASDNEPMINSYFSKLPFWNNFDVISLI